MNSKQLNDYIEGLRRTVAILLFVFLFAILLSYAIVINTSWQLGQWSALVMVIILLAETLLFALGMIIQAWPVLQANYELEKQEPEDKQA